MRASASENTQTAAKYCLCTCIEGKGNAASLPAPYRRDSSWIARLKGLSANPSKPHESFFYSSLMRCCKHSSTRILRLSVSEYNTLYMQAYSYEANISILYCTCTLSTLLYTVKGLAYEIQNFTLDLYLSTFIIIIFNVVIIICYSLTLWFFLFLLYSCVRNVLNNIYRYTYGLNKTNHN